MNEAPSQGKPDRAALIVAALIGLSSVILGAAADHIGFGSDPSVATALRYHQLYAILLTALAITAPVTGRRFRPSFILFTLGCILFCGGIYLSRIPGLHGAVYATPFGGLTLMAGWLALVVSAMRR